MMETTPFRFAVLLAVGVLTRQALAQSPIDVSGTWSSSRVVVLRNYHAMPRGWDQLAENLSTARTYSITITRTQDEVTMAFPSGSNNILTTIGSLSGAEPRTTVTNRGDWWKKDVVSTQWVGSSLQISSTTSTGWWKTETPEKAEPRATDFTKRLTVQLNADRGELSLHVLVADEKGELEYTQVFQRVADRAGRQL